MLLAITANAMYVELHDTNVWRDADGDPVPTSEVQSHDGPEHCEWQEVVFLSVGEQRFLRDRSATYFDVGDDFERWPRLTRPEGVICA